MLQKCIPWDDNMLCTISRPKKLISGSHRSFEVFSRLSVCLSVHPSITPFSLCSHHHVIMKFSGIITNGRGDVHANGQSQRSKIKVTEIKTQFNHFRNVTPGWIHIWLWNDAQSIGEVPCCFSRSFCQISRSHGTEIVTSKIDGGPWKTIGHLFYATSSFVHHFIVIGEFKQELQSGNGQFGSKSTLFVLCDLEIWQMILKNNRAPLLCCFKFCASLHNHRWIQTGVKICKCPIWVKIGNFLCCGSVPIRLILWNVAQITPITGWCVIHHFKVKVNVRVIKVVISKCCVSAVKGCHSY